MWGSTSESATPDLATVVSRCLTLRRSESLPLISSSMVYACILRSRLALRNACCVSPGWVANRPPPLLRSANLRGCSEMRERFRIFRVDYGLEAVLLAYGIAVMSPIISPLTILTAMRRGDSREVGLDSFFAGDAY